MLLYDEPVILASYPFLPDVIFDYNVLNWAVVWIVDDASNKIEIVQVKQSVFDDL